jgi:C4-dicarboxylate-specific signal transduction histidine kinase
MSRWPSTTDASPDATPPAPTPRTRSIRSRLLSFVGVLMIFTTASLVGLGLWFTSETLRDDVRTRLVQDAHQLGEFVDVWVQQQREIAGLIAEDAALHGHLEALEEGSLSPEELAAALHPILTAARNSSSNFRALHVLGPAGRVLASTREGEVGAQLAGDPAYREGLVDRWVGDPAPTNGYWESSVSAPVTHDGKLLGVLVIRVDAAPLHRALQMPLVGMRS